MYGYKAKVNGGVGGYDKYNLGASSHALTCPIQCNKTTDKSSPGASLGTPEDRQHVDKTSLPWHTSTRGQTTQRTDKPSPGTLFRVHQGTDYMETSRSSPGTHFRLHQGTDYMETNRSSPGTTRGQTTWRQTSLSLGPFSGCTRRQTQ